MREHGLIYSAESIRALLAGRKTQTRRVISVGNSTVDGWAAHGKYGRKVWLTLDWSTVTPITDPRLAELPCILVRAPERKTVHRIRPRVQVGDSIVARETLSIGNGELHYQADGECCAYASDGDREADLWDRYVKLDVDEDGFEASLPYGTVSPIHMPRWAARIVVPVTRMGVERVQEISRADAKREGFWPNEHNGLPRYAGKSYGNANLAFQAAWDDINAKRGHPWEANDWVWVYEHERYANAVAS